MRVIFFTETFLPKIDGIVTVLCLLLDHLATRGIAAAVVAPQMGTERYRQAPVIGVPGVRLPLYPELKVGPPTLATYRQVKAFRPDVAHLIGPALIGGGGLLMAWRLGIPTVASFHLDLNRLVHYFGLGVIAPFTRWFTRVTFNAADYALAPSRQVQRELLDLGVRRVGLWRRGVDVERFHPRYRDAAMRDRLSDGHPDDLLLLYAGRLSKEKRLGDLRAALEHLPGARLALVGDGPARAALQAHFAGLPVHFAGYLQGEALSRAYASADLLVFPSAMETFGLVVLEAMASGLPVVASRVGGVTDVVQEGHTGYTFMAGDAAGLVEAVRRAADRDRLAAMGRAARAFAETQTWPAMMDEVVALYEQLVAARRRR